MQIAGIGLGVALAALFACGAHAADTGEKRCILASAAKLPGIPGLAITGSAAVRAARANGQSNAYDVTIDFEAAKQTYHATFDCLLNGPGAVAKMRGWPE